MDCLKKKKCFVFWFFDVSVKQQYQTHGISIQRFNRCKQFFFRARTGFVYVNANRSLYNCCYFLIFVIVFLPLCNKYCVSDDFVASSMWRCLPLIRLKKKNLNCNFLLAAACCFYLFVLRLIAGLCLYIHKIRSILSYNLYFEMKAWKWLDLSWSNGPYCACIQLNLHSNTSNHIMKNHLWFRLQFKKTILFSALFVFRYEMNLFVCFFWHGVEILIPKGILRSIDQYWVWMAR